MKRLAILVAVVGLAVSAGTALATPGTGVAPTPLARGVSADPIAMIQGAGNDGLVAEITVVGTTGWHAETGPSIHVVESGTLTVYNDQCAVIDTVGPGEVAFEAEGGVHIGMTGADPVVLTAYYPDRAPGPPAEAPVVDAAAPACAAGAGLSTAPLSTAGGVTKFDVLSRVNFAAASPISGQANRDVVVQQLTIAPGGHTGWHSHPGSTVIFVQSGTFSFYGPNCVRQNYAAGQGVVEPGGGVQLARNEGTVPLTLFVVYTDVPRGTGSEGIRIEQPEPSTCTGLAAVAGSPAPSALPNTSTATDGLTSVALTSGAALLALASFAAIALGPLSRRRH